MGKLDNYCKIQEKEERQKQIFDIKKIGFRLEIMMKSINMEFCTTPLSLRVYLFMCSS